ncbi:MAG: AAA family ATPase [Methylococcales bacterium]
MQYKPTYFKNLPLSGILAKDGDNPPYVFSDDIVIALDVALATDRPLLVSGKPGCGKSRLADAAAAVQGWNFLGRTITSRTRLEELTVEVDQLRRLNDVQVWKSKSSMKPDQAYHNPGIFWWAFNPDSARRRGLAEKQAGELGVALDYIGMARDQNQGVVLLIDEIDKAEPDLPNDLLEPLDRRRFSLPDGGKIEAASDLKILTIITTNGERELPQAFLRRCVTLELPEPRDHELVTIALQHYPEGNPTRIEAIAKRIIAFRTEAANLRRRPPGTGEFLDAIRACEELDIEVSNEPESLWIKIEKAVLLKTPRI